RQQRRRLVERVGGHAPPDRATQAMVLAFLPRRAIPRFVAAPERPDLIDGLGTGHLAEILEEDRDRLHPVAVTVDHRVLQPGAYLRRSMLDGHDPPLQESSHHRAE